MGHQAIVKPTGVTSVEQALANMLVTMPKGKAYLADVDGALTASEAAAICATQAALATALSTFEAIGTRLAKDAGSYESSVARLEYTGGSFAGERTTKLSVNILGLTADQKAYFESPEFENAEKVLLLVDASGQNAMIIANVTFGAKISGKLGDLWGISLEAEFTGPTADKVHVFPNMPASA